MAGIILTCDIYDTRYVLLIERKYSHTFLWGLKGKSLLENPLDVEEVSSVERRLLQMPLNKLIEKLKIEQGKYTRNNFIWLRKITRFIPFVSIKNRYGFPKGKKEPYDKTLLDTAKREFQEETDIDIDKINISGTFVNHKKRRMYLAYCKNIKLDGIVYGSNEVSRTLFVDIDEIDKYLSLAKNTINTIKNKVFITNPMLCTKNE